MNKFISKMRLPIILCGLLAGSTQVSLAENTPLAEREVQYLDYIESKIQSYVVFSTQWPQNFLSLKNKESYAQHVNRFKEAFLSFERDVLHSLRTEKRTADNNEYGQAINLMHDIVAKLYDQAKHIYSILEKHRNNTNHMILGMELGSTEKYIEPQAISALQSQLRRLQSIFNKIYQALAIKIGAIIDSLEQRKGKKKNAYEAMKALQHRLSCR